jgi:hypothetical protein
MKKVILRSRDRQGDWTDWRIVYLISEHSNCWRIWSLRDLFTRYVHKDALGERIEEL